MRSFACTNCGQLLFFENSHCLRCGAMLGFIPEQLTLKVIEATRGDEVRIVAQSEAGVAYKRCSRVLLAACNWLVAEPDEELCVSCRLTAVAPELRRDHDLQAFAKAEAAKRRLIYQLLDLRLPFVSRHDDEERGLGFVFGFRSESTPIMTGHLNGLITLDLTECDNAHRERLRAAFGEPYRTLLGHFRHEIGHYYWDVLVASSATLEGFRARFGDERESYADALTRNYQQPACADWTERFVSAYAASHPWEDWAETFAHYLHIRDTLQTAATFGLHVSPSAPAVAPVDGKLAARACEDVAQRDFATVIAEWLPLTYAFNAANRSMGKEDLYPFVLAQPVIEKLAFVHDLVRDAGDAARVVAASQSLRNARAALVSEPDPEAAPAAALREADPSAVGDEPRASREPEPSRAPSSNAAHKSPSNDNASAA